MTAYRVVPLGQVLHLDQDEVSLQPTKIYRTAGVYSFGRGIFEREPILGADTSYTSLYRLHRDQFVVSRLNGWEGAVDVVSARHEGCCVSSEYPTFAIDSDEADPRYLRWIARWPRLWEQLTPRGSMVRRKRVNPAQLLEVPIPLPPADVQRQLAMSIELFLSKTATLTESAARCSPQTYMSLLPGLTQEIFSGEHMEKRAIGEMADFISDTVYPGDDFGDATVFVGLQHIESHSGRRLGSTELGSEKGRKFRFQPGDVIYGYLRPYLNKVWVADCHGLCSVDQYVLRPREGACAGLIAHGLRSQSALNEAVRLTHSLQLPRLRSSLLAAIEIPTAAADQPSTERRLDSLVRQICELAEARRRQLELISALEAATLNEVFASLA